jgi:hypothetical protein
MVSTGPGGSAKFAVNDESELMSQYLANLVKDTSLRGEINAASTRFRRSRRISPNHPDQLKP